jgi:hypothetical protein
VTGPNERSGPVRGGRSETEPGQVGSAQSSATLSHVPAGVLGGPLGPCACDNLPDRIDRREPPCDRHTRRAVAYGNVQALERRWRVLAAVARYWRDEVAA